ncbi:putative N protein [Cytorhabdovirus fragariae]|uniref:Nucleoprotein n=1 Tax=Cytorhabdovirus fragariae TaxID=2676436 RepID=A0A650ACQ3_9RHAB|nr:putative N protein [Cytorhabdovirus fragariae]QGN65755.1 putative N protein [Cytorhabdovirus fragariae]
MAALHAAMINKDYDDLVDVSVLPGGSMSIWKDADIPTIRRYTTTTMDITLAVQHGDYVIGCLTDGAGIDSSLVVSMLNLALNLRDPDNPDRKLLKEVATDRASLIRMELPTITAVNNIMDETERRLIRNLNQQGDNAQGFEQAAEEDVLEEEAGEEEDRGSAVMRSAAYSYICAYLMRLQCRNAKNVHDGLKRAAERFRAWYDDKHGILDDLSFSVDSLNKLKDAISRKPELTTTWVLHLAVTENEKQLLQQPKGMLEYLGLQVFSYQGMHALTQVLAIHQISKIPLKDLLKEMDSPLTRDGLREIANILRNYEQTTRHPDRKTYFRYARVWSPKYFAQLQSKICVPLLYVAAVTVRDISPNSIADPTQIYALQNIGASMKEVLNRVAARLVAFVMERTLSDDKSGSIWDAAVEDRQTEAS